MTAIAEGEGHPDQEGSDEDHYSDCGGPGPILRGTRCAGNVVSNRLMGTALTPIARLCL